MASTLIPDLDNANVGTYARIHKGDALASLFFYSLSPTQPNRIFTKTNQILATK